MAQHNAPDSATDDANPPTRTAAPASDDQDPVRLSTLDRIFLPLLIAVLTALSTLGASYFGARIATQGAIATQQLSISEERASETRELRAETYKTYLDLGNAYANATEDATQCIQRKADRAARGEPDNPQECVAELNALASPRFDFQGAYNAVYVYGSDAAWGAAGQLYATLPVALGTYSTEGVPPLEFITQNRFDRTAFGREYADFQRFLRIEGSPTPRANC